MLKWSRVICGAAAIGALTLTGAVKAQDVGFSTEPMLPEKPARKLTKHIWMLDGFPNVYIVVGRKATLVVDTGLGTRNAQFVAREARRLSTRGQTLYLTTTHFHPEHAGGEQGFPAGTVVVRPKAQQAELEASGPALVEFFKTLSPTHKSLLSDARVGTPQRTFDRDYRLDLGSVAVRMMWRGAAHTAGDQLIYVEGDGALITGDVVQNKLVPYFACDTCNPSSWIAVLDAIGTLPIRTVLPDHSVPGDARLIAYQRAFLDDLRARTAALKAEGQSAEQAGRTIATEFATKYPDWRGRDLIPMAVQKAFATP